MSDEMDEIGQDDGGGYIHYPDPVEEGAVGYDQLFMVAVEGDGVVAVLDVPGRDAVYWGNYSAPAESPLRSDKIATRERANTRLVQLVGRRVEEALQD